MNSKKIDQAQNDLQQISQTLKAANRQEVHLIDVDLSLDKIRQIYEYLTEIKLEVLSSSPKGITEEAKPMVEADKPKAKEVQVKKKSEKVEKAQEIKIDFIEEPLEAPKPLDKAKEELIEIVVESEPEPKAESKAEPKAEIKQAPEQKTTQPETPKTPKAKPSEESTASRQKTATIETNETIADRFENQTSLNDLLSNIKDNEDLATLLKNSPIDDLKSAISLNDKIWFTRELFAGDNQKYADTIEQFNSLNNMDEALSLANSFAWNHEEDSTQQFLKLIYRKFV